MAASQGPGNLLSGKEMGPKLQGGSAPGGEVAPPVLAIYNVGSGTGLP